MKEKKYDSYFLRSRKIFKRIVINVERSNGRYSIYEKRKVRF